MSIKVGDIDLAQEIIELHYQLKRTQRLLEIALGKIPVVGPVVTQEEISSAENYALDYIKNRFPNMGIKKN